MKKIRFRVVTVSLIFCTILILTSCNTKEIDHSNDDDTIITSYMIAIKNLI